jgi:hypothetical protein
MMGRFLYVLQLCRLAGPARVLADYGEIPAYDSPLYQCLECASLFGYGIEVSKSRDA